MENFGIDNSAYASKSSPPAKAERNPNSAWLTTFMVGLTISAVLAVLGSFAGGLLVLIVVMAIGSFFTMGIAAVVMFLTSGKG
ncbi:hypothetical protein [Microbacterium sp. WCS2018Hpa-9]|uniref:hypothetical protein n=1 Tax=Microbacterium sp. WCS2018Hpa-9 TaxID=3073635 RepID=UPI0028899EFD|nr:hypothetical protein [Microbacterium sp. WCS2018Hpa-9]